MSSTGVPFGPYLLGPRLARGGMGEVYVGVRREPSAARAPVALKLLLPHLGEDPEAVALFLDEARIAARMDHPNVVRIHEVGLTQGRYFIAMELVRGVALSRLVSALSERGEPVPPRVIAHLARQLLQGLHHAHELGVIHRDVSPQNVLLSVDGEVKLTDFGIAKVRDWTGPPASRSVQGKWEYLPPEQARGAPLDRRADVYGAALTLYQLATLSSPFRRATQALTLAAVQEDPLPALAPLRPDLPAAWVQAIERASRKDPEERFPTALAFRDAFVPAETDPAQGAKALSALVQHHCPEALSPPERTLQEDPESARVTAGLGPPSATLLRRLVAGVTRWLRR